jgi:hypothetical protein
MGRENQTANAPLRFLANVPGHTGQRLALLELKKHHAAVIRPDRIDHETAMRTREKMRTD